MICRFGGRLFTLFFPAVLFNYNVFMKIIEILKNSLSADELSAPDQLLLDHGLHILLQDGSEYLSVFLLSLFLRRIPETLLFCATFLPLRVRCGGLHARSPAACFAGFLMMYAFVLLFSSLSPAPPVLFLSCILSVLLLRKRVPAVHPLNPLSSGEYALCRRLAVCYLFLFTAAEAVLLLLQSSLSAIIPAVFLLNVILVLLQSGGNVS